MYLSFFDLIINIDRTRPGGAWSAAKPNKGGCVPLSAMLLAQGSLVARPNALPIGLARPEERGRIHLVKTTPRPPTGATTPMVLRHQQNGVSVWHVYVCVTCCVCVCFFNIRHV